MASIAPAPISDKDLYDGLFFKIDEPRIASAITERIPFSLVVANIITSYVISTQDVFGAAEWALYYKVNVVNLPPAFPDNFYKIWWGPVWWDSNQPNKRTDNRNWAYKVDDRPRVYEVYAPPILLPRVVEYLEDISLQKRIYSLNIERLSILIRKFDLEKKPEHPCLNSMRNILSEPLLPDFISQVSNVFNKSTLPSNETSAMALLPKADEFQTHMKTINWVLTKKEPLIARGLTPLLPAPRAHSCMYICCTPCRACALSSDD